MAQENASMSDLSEIRDCLFSKSLASLRVEAADSTEWVLGSLAYSLSLNSLTIFRKVPLSTTPNIFLLLHARHSRIWKIMNIYSKAQNGWFNDPSAHAPHSFPSTVKECDFCGQTSIARWHGSIIRQSHQFPTAHATRTIATQMQKDT